MLRWRLLVGLISIFVLLVVTGGYSIWLVLQLKTDINSIFKNNYESIRDANNLQFIMLSMNAAYLKSNPADLATLSAKSLKHHYTPRLERTLDSLQLLSTETEEKSHVQRLKGQVTDYVLSLQHIIETPPKSPDRYFKLRTELQTKIFALNDTIQKILKHNENGMMQAYQRTQQAASNTVTFLVGAMIVAMAVFIYTYFSLGRSIVDPIENLTHSINAMRARKFEKNLPVSSNDELGQLARTFNAMADELRAYHRDIDETIIRLNRSLREAIGAFPYPVMLLDSDYAIWVTNEAAETFLKNLDSTNDLPPTIRERLEEVRRTGINYLPEGPRDSLPFRMGERIVHYLPRILCIFSPEGDVSGAAIILIDVSRFRWLDDMKTNLISTISHEIKTPLTGIRMILHLLQEKSGGNLTKVQEEMVQAGCDDCERLLSTLNSLLELSRMEAGRTQLDLNPVSPKELLEETRNAFQVQAMNHDITLTIDADDKIPLVLADQARMVHVIGNFTSNALKFAPQHSTVYLTADCVGEEFVRLSVIDSGPGIPNQFHAQVFDKFFRTPGHREEGVGLGLSIAREIVHAHDGRIGVESIPNVATRFFCELPIAS